MFEGGGGVTGPPRVDLLSVQVRRSRMLASSKHAGKKRRRAEKLAALQERVRNERKSGSQWQRGFAKHLVRSESCCSTPLICERERGGKALDWRERRLVRFRCGARRTATAGRRVLEGRRILTPSSSSCEQMSLQSRDMRGCVNVHSVTTRHLEEERPALRLAVVGA